MAKDDIRHKLIAARQVMVDPRLRILSGKKKTLIEDGNVYGERIEEEEFDRLSNESYTKEAIRRSFLAAMSNLALSVEELSDITSLEPDIVFKHLLVLQQRGMIEVERIENHRPYYRVTGQA